MTSRRSWLLGLALGAAVTVGSIHDAHAQSVPRSFTYQGQLLENGQPVTGLHTIVVSLYDSGSQTPIWSGTYSTNIVDGIFNLTLPESGSFPAALDFNQQYSLGVAIDGQPELLPLTPLHSAPYAINADAVDGFDASVIAAPNKVVASDASGKIDAAWLPALPNYLLTVNGIPGNPAGDFQIIQGSGIDIVAGANSITISASGTGGGIQSITAGPGLIGGGGPDQNGNVFIGLGPNAIDGTMIGNGVITGRKLSSDVAGEGIYQDILGNLNVGVDGTSIEISGDQLRIKAGGVGTGQLADGAVTTPKIADGAVTAAKVDPNQIQLRVTGVAPAGSFITGINANGTVNSATVLVNSTLTRAVTGSDLTLGINLANPNTWTGAQDFNGGATASTLTVTGATTTNGITNTGNIATTTLNSTGNVTVGGNLAVTGTTALTGAATTNGITNTGNVATTTFNSTGDASVGGNFAVTGTTTLTGAATTNGITNTGNVGTTTLSTTGSATIGDDLTVTNQITAPAAGHSMGTVGTNATVLTINGVTDGGAVDEFVVNGDAAFTGVVDLNTVNATTITATTVNTANLGGNGGAITLTSDVNANTQTINNGIYNGYTLQTGNIAVGHTLTNNGTITGGAITNALISGGTINGTIIGNTTPAEGTFTDITVNSLADINQLQVNTTSHFDGLATFGSAPALNGNKVVIEGVVSPTPIALSTDYELVVNGDAQVTGTMFANNFQSLVLQAPLILFDVAQPFSGTTMTFQAGTMIHNGLGTFDDGMTFVNTPAGFYSINVLSNPGANGIKLTGAPGSPVGLDVDPYDLGVRVDAVNMGIQIMNAPVSLEADGIIDAMGTIENSAGNVTINDALDQTGGGQVMFSGNVDANNGLDVTGDLNQSLGQVTLNGNVDATNGLDVTGATTLTGTVTQSGGQVIFNSNVDATAGLDVIGATTMDGNLQFLGAADNISNAAALQVTIDDGINQTGGNANNFSGSIAGAAAGNTIGSGANATQLTVNGVVGGATEFIVNGDAQVTGTMTIGGLSMAGDIDMNAFDIIDLDDLVFSQAGSEISNTGGAVTVNDAFTQLGAGNQVMFGGNVDANNGLDVTGITNMTGALAQSGGQVSFGGNVDANAGLDVTGASTFAGTMTQTGGGQITLSGNVDANGGLDVVGIMTQTGGQVTLNGNVDATNGLDVTGASTFAGTMTQTGGGQITLSGNVDANGGLDVVGLTTMTGAVTQSGGQVTFGGNVDANAGLDVVGASTFAGTMTQTGGGQITLSGNVDANGGLDVVGATTMVGSLTQSGGNVSLATTAGNTTTIGNTTGAMSLTGSTITVAGTTDINTAGDFNTSIGNAAGATNNTTIGVGTGGDLTLNGIDADAVPTQWLTLNGANQVRTTLISGTADEGVSWDAAQGRYELGGETNTAVPFVANPRWVNIDNSVLNFSRNGGAETALQINGGAAGTVNLQTGSGDLNLGNATGLNTIMGRTVADGTGIGANDVMQIINTQGGQEGLHIMAAPAAGTATGIRSDATGVAAAATAGEFTAAGTGSSTGVDASAIGTGGTNIGVNVVAMNGATTNTGVAIDVNGTTPTGVTVNANNAAGSNGMVITGAVNGVGVTLPNGTNGTAFIANLDAGDNQSGLRVDMNAGGAGAVGVSVSEIGSGTGAAIDMTGAAGATGLNVTAVTTNTGISVLGVTGGGIGVSSQYSDVAGAGSAMRASSASANPASSAIVATGVATGAAAVNITAGDLKSSAAGGDGTTLVQVQNKIADQRTVQAGEAGFATVTVFNSLVTANSTIILSVQEAGVNGYVFITAKAAGSFTVTSTATWDAGDVINYMIVNPN